MLSSRLGKRLSRFAVGSGLATLTSAFAFAVGYRMPGGGPLVATAAAFAAGAIVNFAAARFWAWERRGRSGLGRETISYLLVAVVSGLAASGVTTVTHAALAGTDADIRAVLVEASYFATYAVLFLAKFVVLDRLVFRSRHQVPTTTRA